MPMLGAMLTPHPPVLLPEVGRGREREIAATGRAMEEAARAVAGWNPDVLIVSSPHTILYGDYFHIAPGAGASGATMCETTTARGAGTCDSHGRSGRGSAFCAGRCCSARSTPAWGSSPCST